MNKDEVREWWVDKESENLMDRRTGTNSEHWEWSWQHQLFL